MITLLWFGAQKNLSKTEVILCDPAGTRTQDPYIKSVLLYQLSYQISPFETMFFRFGSAKIGGSYITPKKN